MNAPKNLVKVLHPRGEICGHLGGVDLADGCYSTPALLLFSVRYRVAKNLLAGRQVPMKRVICLHNGILLPLRVIRMTERRC